MDTLKLVYNFKDGIQTINGNFKVGIQTINGNFKDG